MLGQILYFFAGIILAAAVFIPVSRYYKRQIREAESQNAKSASFALGFREESAKLACALKESVKAVSVPVFGDSGDSAASMGKIENTFEENTRIVAEIVEKTGSVAAIASKMENDVLKGFSVLEKNVKKMGDIKEKNSGVINGIISLGNKVNKIRDIVRVITTITDQTKVIAFNAAIEAASAGDTGKRFAVVAGEVNRLADDIAVLTRQIREQVEEIQSSSSSLIFYSEDGSDKIAEGYKLIKDLENIFKEIKSGAEITSNQASTITVSTQQQLKSSELIHSDVSEVSRELKHYSGAVQAAAMSVAAVRDRAVELEHFLLVNGKGEHGD